MLRDGHTCKFFDSGRVVAVDDLPLLADLGRHCAPSVPDLLVAATAELARLSVVHLDKDFDLIADVTGQPTERLAGHSAAH